MGAPDPWVEARSVGPRAFFNPFVCMPGCLAACLAACLVACLPARPCLWLLARLSGCFVWLPVCLPGCASVCLPGCLAACLAACLPAGLCLWLLARLSGCLSGCLSACRAVPLAACPDLYPHRVTRQVVVATPLLKQVINNTWGSAGGA